MQEQLSALNSFTFKLFFSAKNQESNLIKNFFALDFILCCFGNQKKYTLTSMHLVFLFEVEN